MDFSFPIFTAEAQCQDCYKCVRRCPVKAIQVTDGHARVVPDLCVACGTCVAVCPAHAKKIRDDLGRARRLLQGGRRVYLSLAPSWVSEFTGVSAARMVAALHRLGFAGVSETALGAQQVSAAMARQLPEAAPGVYLSSACPAAVRYVERYMPEHADAITQVHSPVLAHAKMLRAEYGEDIAVVFAGPCIAKKDEADLHPGLLDLALTFADLHRWFSDEGVCPGEMDPGEMDRFVPEAAHEGARYPIEGGMIETIKAHGGQHGTRFAAVTGIEGIHRALDGLAKGALDAPVFVECLSCAGGCVNGPCMQPEGAALLRRMAVEDYAPAADAPVERAPSVDVAAAFRAQGRAVHPADEAQLRAALRQVGKDCAADELNCGGCGYNTCRAFAQAMLDGKAEPTMCVSHMRRLAQKKANALLRSIPNGVVIVNHALRIVECNEAFARLFAEEEILEVCEGMANCRLDRVAPFAHLFERLLRSGEESLLEHVRHEQALYDVTLFTIEPHQVVGAIIQDVTRQEIRRDQIAHRANEVIQKNLSTVQEIACMLGEHMADTEMLLRSIADGYTTPAPKADARGVRDDD